MKRVAQLTVELSSTEHTSQREQEMKSARMIAICKWDLKKLKVTHPRWVVTVAFGKFASLPVEMLQCPQRLKSRSKQFTMFREIGSANKRLSTYKSQKGKPNSRAEHDSRWIFLLSVGYKCIQANNFKTKLTRITIRTQIWSKTSISFHLEVLLLLPKNLHKMAFSPSY